MASKAVSDLDALQQRIAELEAALEACDDRYQRLCAVAPVGIFRTDVLGKCHYVNDRWSEITGLTEEEARGDGWARALHPDDRKRVFEEWSAVATSGRQFAMEYRLLNGRGETIWVFGQGVAEQDDAGEIAGCVGTITDITRRKHAEEKLHRRDEQLMRVLDATRRMYTELALDKVLQAIADGARNVLDCQYTALGILDNDRTGLGEFVVSGLSEEEKKRIGDPPAGKGLLGLLIDDPRPLRVADIVAHPASAGFPAYHPPMKTFLGVPIMGSEGAIGNLYCTEKNGGTEFTEDDEEAAQMLAAAAALAVQNARLVTELRRLQVTRHRFYAMVSHELRNALTGVHGWSELLLRKSGDDPPKEIKETVESAEYALELLTDLLDLTRLDEGKVQPAPTKGDARSIVRDALTTIQPEADSAGITVEFSADTDVISCRTDAKRVRQIIINLVRNAIQHSGGDNVTVELAADDSQLTFAVADRGEGISPEQLTIIFDAYARADSKSGGGTGLGLTLCRRLARLLGGDIAVASQVGEGARFTVRIERYLAE